MAYNLANELDIEMDAAIKRQLGRLYDSYFQSQEPSGTKTTTLTNSIKQLENDIEAGATAVEGLL